MKSSPEEEYLVDASGNKTDDDKDMVGDREQLK